MRNVKCVQPRSLRSSPRWALVGGPLSVAHLSPPCRAWPPPLAPPSGRSPCVSRPAAAPPRSSSAAPTRRGTDARCPPRSAGGHRADPSRRGPSEHGAPQFGPVTRGLSGKQKVEKDLTHRKFRQLLERRAEGFINESFCTQKNIPWLSFINICHSCR